MAFISSLSAGVTSKLSCSASLAKLLTRGDSWRLTSKELLSIWMYMIFNLIINN